MVGLGECEVRWGEGLGWERLRWGHNSRQGDDGGQRKAEAGSRVMAAYGVRVCRGSSHHPFGPPC